MNGPARIAILFETFQEFQIIRRHLGRLREWEVPYAMTLASALKSPERLARWIAEHEHAGVEVFIVAAGGGASLAGAVAARTDRPVVGVPLDTTHLRGQDALHAMTGLPAGVPVAVVGVNNVESAFHWALRLLALRHPDYGLLLKRLRSEWAEKETESLENLRDQYPECFPPEETEDIQSKHSGLVPVEPETVTKPIAGAPERESGSIETPPGRLEQTEEESTLPGIKAPRGRRKGSRIVVNPEHPDVAAIEEVTDILLEGGIVALPTDTVYGLAAVSTNGDAVRRLYEIKGRERNKSIPLLIHSTKGLAHLVRQVPDAVRPLLESHWPGGLTVVFRKYQSAFAEVTSDDTIGLRMPNHTVTLAVLSMVARPLAVTSANLSGKPPALTADDVLESFGDSIECVLDAGRTPGKRASTVLSVIESPFRILREGAISFSNLKAILGDDLVGL